MVRVESQYGPDVQDRDNVTLSVRKVSVEAMVPSEWTSSARRAS